MNKDKVKNRLFELQDSIIETLREKIETTHTMVDIDEEDTIDPEDFSHQHESGVVKRLITDQLVKELKNLEQLKQIDFNEKQSVMPGAIVKTNSFNFFIGLATLPFEVDEERIIGISTASPIYALLAHKEEGEGFSFRGNDYIINSIH